TGTDGTQGLYEIKAVGGITFAQDEQSAKYNGMPQSAAGGGCADFVLPPNEIAKRLTDIGAHPYLIARAELEHADDIGAPYRRTLARIRAVTGVDFSLYRDTTIKRRIMRRMALHSHGLLPAYVERLESDAKEVEALYNDLLINVTSFFRDPELFDALKRSVFPAISQNKPPLTPLRVWVPGCSTGQEAYSLAMSLVEFFDDKPTRPPIQIFATDLSDPPSLGRARAGIYPETVAAEVTPERLCRFFRKEDQGYRVEKLIRDMCVFARQNVAADPPFSRLDMISCRNLLIYLSTQLQKRVLPTFHYALNVPGFLVLGSAETVGENITLFEPVDRANKIYVKKTGAARTYERFAADEHQAVTPGSSPRSRLAAAAPIDFQQEADRILLRRYSPPGVLVNENFDIIQFRGRTSPYLEQPPGEPTSNLLKMAGEGLFLELRIALSDAGKQHQSVRREDVRVRIDGEARKIALEVIPVKPPSAGRDCFLVLFHDSGDRSKTGQGSGEKVEVLTLETPDADAPEVAQLRKELSATQEYLQSLAEQQEAANEEMRSANEEILSSNEELQSTNEELETAKEELQSTNEELTTVNEQLQHRNAELNQITDDLKKSQTALQQHTGMLALTREAIFAHEWQGSIVYWNHGATELYGYTAAEAIGRTSHEILRMPDYAAMEEFEAELERQGHWVGELVHRTRDDRQVIVESRQQVGIQSDGRRLVLETNRDITESKRLARELSERVNELKEADRHKNEFLATLAHELRNPLAPILSAVELLRVEELSQQEAAWCRDVVERQVKQRARLLDDLLDVGRITADKLELRKERLPLAQVIETAVETSRPYIEAAGHKLLVNLPSEPIFIEADSARLAQVFSNLLNNAAKYTRHGGVVSIGAERQDGQALLRVKDNGIGIPSELLPRIFELFVQEEYSTGNEFGGLGVGLTLVRKLVELHGGSVEAQSAGRDQGSEFIVRLPLAGEPAVPEKRSGFAPVTAPCLRILIVDDRPEQTRTMRMLLARMGHETQIASDGANALRILEDFPCDVGLIDIGLQGMSGYDLARFIRERPKFEDMILIAQTGWGRD
ncbi:MAG: CheR family methyltransferase, partial [Candidatus Binatia bacterium]